MSTDQCVKGINWGEISIDDRALFVKHNKQNLIKVPIKKIINSNTQKNDIVIQLSTDDCDQNDDMLCELRFYVPPNQNDQQKVKLDKKKREPTEEGADRIQEEDLSDSDIDEEAKMTFQQQLQNEILTRAKIGQSSADSVASIHDVPLIVPRGKYNIDLFRNSIRFHGSTYQFTTEYKSIQKLFMLPMPDEVNISIVIGLEKPLKQGQTTYNYMVMQFRKDLENEVKMRYTKEKLNDIGWLNIQESYQGPLYDIVCQLLTEISGVKIVIPKNFKSKNNSNSLRCSVGPHQGNLFPLEKGLIYISKPVFYFKHEDIKEVIFQRISQQSNLNKLFDMKIVGRTSQLFAGIERGELENLNDYFFQKKIKVSRIQEDVAKIPVGPSDDDDEDDDIDEDDSRQQENKRRQAKNTNNQQLMQNLDSDEDDEDFEAGQDDDDSDDISEVSDDESVKDKKKK